LEGTKQLSKKMKTVLSTKCIWGWSILHLESCSLMSYLARGELVMFDILLFRQVSNGFRPPGGWFLGAQERAFVLAFVS
jgi:hypothetical protein